ncbi:MAG: acetyl-CoA carboxylase carboxyltransferase subunit, partial [Myxococcota bacterium]
MATETAKYLLENPLAESAPLKVLTPLHPSAAVYEESIERGLDLLDRPKRGGGPARVRVQHAKNRMTVFERLKVLSDREPNLLWQNWGKA